MINLMMVASAIWRTDSTITTTKKIYRLGKNSKIFSKVSEVMLSVASYGLFGRLERSLRNLHRLFFTDMLFSTTLDLIA